MGNTKTSRSAETLLTEHLIGKTLVKLEYADEPLKKPRKITDVSIEMDESREDAVIYITTEVFEDDEYEENIFQAFANEDIILLEDAIDG